AIVSRWIEVAKVDECPPGTAIERVAGDRIVALYRVGDAFYALDGVCPHQGGPLGKGELSGCIVTCPWHGWQFDVTSGQHQISPSIRQPAFEVRQDGDSVLVRIEENP
ncbi:MAG: Rieske (2Fe-2S) protein, partial [Pirellulales bacterium]